MLLFSVFMHRSVHGRCSPISEPLYSNVPYCMDILCVVIHIFYASFSARQMLTHLKSHSTRCSFLCSHQRRKSGKICKVKSIKESINESITCGKLSHCCYCFTRVTVPALRELDGSHGDISTVVSLNDCKELIYFQFRWCFNIVEPFVMTREGG